MQDVHIPAIVYHQILSDGMPVRPRKPGEGLISGQTYLADFVRQMEYLSEQGFTSVTASQLQAWLYGTGTLPKKPIVIDFDDHSMISYKNAFPVMRDHGRVATMFVISGAADGDPWLDGNPLADTEVWSIPRMRWRELEALVEAGWDIAAHTRTHWMLTSIPGGPDGDAHIMNELARGKTDIEENLGVTATHFTYPNGLWNERVEGMVKQVYRSARHFHCFGRARYITKGTDPYRLPTMNINSMLSFEDFRRLVDRTAPDHEYCPESRAIGHAGTPP